MSASWTGLKVLRLLPVLGLIVVKFSQGTVEYRSSSSEYYVRCVRGPSTTRSFTDNGDSTVTDTKTGLVWQQTSGSQRNWTSSLTYCEDLTLASQSDWRLPNIKELGSIVDVSEQRGNPAIDETAFPGTQQYYWSSTPKGSNVQNFDFNYGRVANEIKSNSFYVRCVRGGQ